MPIRRQPTVTDAKKKKKNRHTTLLWWSSMSSWSLSDTAMWLGLQQIFMNMRWDVFHIPPPVNFDWMRIMSTGFLCRTLREFLPRDDARNDYLSLNRDLIPKRLTACQALWLALLPFIPILLLLAIAGGSVFSEPMVWLSSYTRPAQPTHYLRLLPLLYWINSRLALNNLITLCRTRSVFFSFTVSATMSTAKRLVLSLRGRKESQSTAGASSTRLVSSANSTSPGHELDEIAVVSGGAESSHISYGSLSLGQTNGPRYIPGELLLCAILYAFWE